MALSLDGHAISNGNSGSATVALTTSNTNDIIIVYVGTAGSGGGATVSSMSGGSLTWAKRKQVNTTNVLTYNIEEWWALAASALSAVTITATLSASVNWTMGAFGVNGANISTPFDPNVSLPSTGVINNTSTATFGPTVSTSQSNTMIMGFFNVAGAKTFTAGTGFTIVDQQANSFSTAMGEEGLFSSPQSGLAVNATIAASPTWVTIGDALQAAVSGVPFTDMTNTNYPSIIFAKTEIVGY